jgi:thioester reductase-like protein
VTGAPNFVAIRLVWCILAAEKSTSVTLLVRPDAVDRTEALLQRQMSFRSRITLLRGDTTRPSLGLGSTDLFQLRERTTDIYQFDSLYHIGHSKARVEEVNIGGTRNLLDFARTVRALNRFNFYSTAFVCGDRSGVVLEDELERGQHFRNTYERTRFTAELEVKRSSSSLPVTIYRPSLLVGDSRTGELGPLDGPHYLVGMLVNAPARVPMMLPSAGTYPMHLVPVDFVAQAIHVLSQNPEAEGRTLHLVDPNPLSTRHALRLIQQFAGGQQDAASRQGRWLANLALRVPAVERLARQGREFLHEIENPVVFNSMYTMKYLAATGVTCPPFPDYAARLVEYVRADHDMWQVEQDDNLS